jgi:hypothetical protein
MALHAIVDVLLIALFLALIACGFAQGGFKMYDGRSISNLPPKP